MIKITLIHVYQWESITVDQDKETVQKFIEEHEKQKKQWIDFWNSSVKVNNISQLVEKTDEYNPIELFIFWLPKDIRKIVNLREKEKMEKIWHWFKSIEEIQKFIEKIKSEKK